MGDYSVWLNRLLAQLAHSGPQGEATLQLLINRKVNLSFHDQPTAARWTLTGHIQLHPRYAAGVPGDPYPLSLVIHEMRHLEQRLFTALSVYGELDAWRVQFSFIKSLTGAYHSDPQRDLIISKLMSLGLSGDRGALSRARNLMQEYAGKTYRVDLLPLYPLPREVYFLFTRKQVNPS